MKNTLNILDTGITKRLHTFEIIKEQNTAEHSWGVAAIICNVMDNPSANLLKAALFHDCAEKIIGDIPYFTKKDIIGIDILEREANDSLGLKCLYENLTQEELEILKIADLLELGYKCIRERNLGNLNLSEVSVNVFNIVNNILDESYKIGYDTEENFKTLNLLIKTKYDLL